MNAWKWAGRLGAVWVLVLIGLFVTGCHTAKPESSSTQFSDVQGGPSAGAGTAPAPGGSHVNATDSHGSGATVPVNFGAGNPPDYRLKVGDLVTVNFADLPMSVMPFEGRVKEDGTITLILNQTFQVIGKTIGELEREIRERYVPRYFKYMTVMVKVAEGSRYYYVGGEVKSAGAKPYVARLKILQAIQAAGDFTEFANRKKVLLSRADGRKQYVDCKKAQIRPELNVEIFPDDTITVKKSPF